MFVSFRKKSWVLLHWLLHVATLFFVCSFVVTPTFVAVLKYAHILRFLALWDSIPNGAADTSSGSQSIPSWMLQQCNTTLVPERNDDREHFAN